MAQALHTPPWLGRALALSAIAHVVALIVLRVTVHPAAVDAEPERIDIEVAPAPEKAQALPAEVARLAEEEAAAAAAAAAANKDDVTAAAAAAKEEAGEGDRQGIAVDAGVDAPIDAPPDAPIDARTKPDAAPKPDAAIDAAAPMVAQADAGVGDGGSDRLAVTDAGSGDGGGSGDRLAVTDAGGGSGSGGGERIAAAESGSGQPQREAAAESGSGQPQREAVAESGSGSGSGTGSGTGNGSGNGSGPGNGSGLPGVAAAVAMGSGAGVPGMTDEPAVDGEPTTAGTAANLLAYFPSGHVVSALIRFDRLRNTEWAAQTERLLKPMPDHRVLFGARATNLADKLDTLVISSSNPSDAAATTLVAHTALSRAEIRDLLANPRAPITWTTVRGGMLGTRGGRLFPGDKRLVLSPWPGWFLLAQPADLGALTTAVTGDIDKLTATGKLPAWLQTIRKIEEESGTDKRGPALVVTFAGDGKPYTFPDMGLGVTSLPSPQRISLALELVKQGWLLRGNIKFAKEADAKEFVTAVEDAQERLTGSYAMSRLLASQHLLNVVKGLSLSRTGARVSYATSLSIADARTLLTGAALALDNYFHQPP